MLFGNIIAIQKISKSRDDMFFILKGPKGLGKSIVGNSLAKYTLCLTKRVDCQCESCRKVRSGTHPDLILLSKEKDSNSIKVDDIRRIFTEVHTRPLVSNFKVVVIDDANYLTKESQNKLLKQLEEPPEYMKFIFITHNDLLPTVESRGKIFKFFALPEEEMDSFLTQLPLHNQIDKEILTATTSGCPGVAYRLFKGTFLNTFKEVIDLYTRPSTNDSKERILQIAGLLKEKDSNCILDVLGDDIEFFLYGIRTFWLDSLKLLCQSDRIIFNSKKAVLINMSLDISKVKDILSLIDKSIQDLRAGRLAKELLIQILIKEVGQ